MCPIVKVQTFHKGGHHATCSERVRYLEGPNHDRHLSRDVFNVSRPDAWARELDATRAAYSLRGEVTYREFVISPDPQDHASPNQVRELAASWVQRNFPNCEAVVILHNDNRERTVSGERGIPHAHCVVNSVELDTGRKVNLSNERVRELHNSLQELARERGLREIERYERGQRLESRQERSRTISERQMELAGRESWKSTVREMALQAKEVSHSLEEFRGCLRMADIELEVRKDRIYLVDRDNPGMACRADKLDKELSAKELSHAFERSLEIERKRESSRVFEKKLAAELKREIAQGQEHKPHRDYAKELQRQHAAEEARNKEREHARSSSPKHGKGRETVGAVEREKCVEHDARRASRGVERSVAGQGREAATHEAPEIHVNHELEREAFARGYGLER